MDNKARIKEQMAEVYKFVRDASHNIKGAEDRKILAEAELQDAQIRLEAFKDIHTSIKNNPEFVDLNMFRASRKKLIEFQETCQSMSIVINTLTATVDQLTKKKETLTALYDELTRKLIAMVGKVVAFHE